MASTLNELHEKAQQTINDLIAGYSRKESSTIEFKVSYNAGDYERFAKSVAAFSNNQGGAIVFGVQDRPREAVGLKNGQHFNEDRFRNTYNNYFYPEANWMFGEVEINGLRFGVLAVTENVEKPTICRSSSHSELEDGRIYYRYHGQNLPIKSSDLIDMINTRVYEQLAALAQRVELIAQTGPSNSAVLDLNHGELAGERATVYIDQQLVDKVNFIRKGSFEEGGKPTLRLVGDAELVKVKPSDDENAMGVTIDETNYKEYVPLEYYDVMNMLRERIEGFKMNSGFFEIWHRVKSDQEGKTMYLRKLDPKHSTGKMYFSEAFVDILVTEIERRGVFTEND